MEISRDSESCTIIPDSPSVDHVRLEYDTGRCTIRFCDGSESSFARDWESYHVFTYGLSFTDDGSILFTGDWEKGLYAVDPRSGETLWRYRPAKIRKIFVFPEYLLALRHGASVIKLDVRTGQLLGELTGRSLVGCWRLDGRHLLLDSKGGKLCVLDAETMAIVGTYRRSGAKTLVDPNNCLSLVIRQAWLAEGRLMISGFEEYPNRDFSAAGPVEFVRDLGVFTV